MIGPCATCGKYGCAGHDPGPLYAKILANAGGDAEKLKPARAVQRSDEFLRIQALPRREWETRDQSHVEAFFMQHLRAPGGTQRLRPVQIAALWEMHAMKGLFVQAKPGSGKCVWENSEIYDTQNACRRQVKQTGYVEVPSFASDGKQVIGRSVIFPSGVKPCVRLTLEDGSSVVLSTDHPVYTHYGWIAAAKVPMDSLVGVPRWAPEPERPAEVPDDEVALMAYLLSDGCVSQDFTSFTNGTPFVKYDFCRVVRAVTGKEPSVKQVKYLAHLGRDENCTNYNVLNATPFRKKWDLRGLAKDKRLPASFWGLPNRQVGLFLNRFWACDGYVNDRGFEIVLASEKMIDDLKFLCLRLGVRARKRYRASRCTNCKDPKKVYHSWRLSMSGEDAIRFGHAIGPILGKEVSWTKVMKHLSSLKHNTNTDLVPVNREVGYAMCDEMGLTSYAMGRGNRKGKRPMSGRVEFASKILPINGTRGSWTSRERFARACAHYGYKGRLAWLTTSDMAWERVRSIEPVGNLPVYDLTVEGTHNFVCDNVIVHNTIVSLLGFIVLNSTSPLLIVPAALKEKTLRDIQRYRKDWLVPAYIRILSYELIGRPQSAALLEEYKPDVVIMDEAHRAKSSSSAVTKRLKDYFQAHPETKIVAMSGTIAKRSIKDYAHIADWCLKEKSPVPRDFKALVEWSSAIDDEKSFVTEEGERTFDDQNQSLEPGALLELCSQQELADPDRLRGVRRAYRRRLTDTPGVIATQQEALGISLTISLLTVKDPAITAAAAQMRQTWERPDGAEFFDTLEMFRHLRTLGCGFYHRWNPAPPDEWRGARRDWAALVREILRTNRRGLHSEVPVREAVEAGLYGDDTLSVLNRWKELSPQYDPEKNKEAIWISAAALNAAATWASKHPGIIWVSYPEFGNVLSQRTGLPFYWNKGLDAKGRFIEDHPKRTAMITSIHANSAGLNLQNWTENLIVTPPTTGLMWEQCISRTLREGQVADEVSVDVMAAVPESLTDFDRARADAIRATDTEGQEQHLCTADITIPPPHERGGLWQV